MALGLPQDYNPYEQEERILAPNTPAPTTSDFSRTFDISRLRMAADTQRGLAAAFRLLGKEQTARNFESKASQYDQQASTITAPTTQSLADVKDASSLGGYVQNLGGQTLASAAHMLPYVLGGGAAGRLVRKGGGTAVGGAAGGFYSSAAPQAGAIYNDLQQNGVDPITAAKTALTAGAAGGALDTLSGGMGLLKARNLARGQAKSPWRDIRNQAITEGITEVGQEGIADAARMYHDLDPNWKTNPVQYLDAAIGGAFGGATMTAPAAGYRAGKNYFDKLAEDRTIQNRDFDYAPTPGAPEGSILDQVFKATTPKDFSLGELQQPKQDPRAEFGSLETPQQYDSLLNELDLSIDWWLGKAKAGEFTPEQADSELLRIKRLAGNIGNHETSSPEYEAKVAKKFAVMWSIAGPGNDRAQQGDNALGPVVDDRAPTALTAQEPEDEANPAEDMDYAAEKAAVQARLDEVVAPSTSYVRNANDRFFAEKLGNADAAVERLTTADPDNQYEAIPAFDALLEEAEQQGIQSPYDQATFVGQKASARTSDPAVRELINQTLRFGLSPDSDYVSPDVMETLQVALQGQQAVRKRPRELAQAADPFEFSVEDLRPTITPAQKRLVDRALVAKTGEEQSQEMTREAATAVLADYDKKLAPLLVPNSKASELSSNRYVPVQDRDGKMAALFGGKEEMLLDLPTAVQRMMHKISGQLSTSEKNGTVRDVEERYRQYLGNALASVMTQFHIDPASISPDVEAGQYKGQVITVGDLTAEAKTPTGIRQRLDRLKQQQESVTKSLDYAQARLRSARKPADRARFSKTVQKATRAKDRLETYAKLMQQRLVRASRGSARPFSKEEDAQLAALLSAQDSAQSYTEAQHGAMDKEIRRLITGRDSQKRGPVPEGLTKEEYVSVLKNNVRRMQEYISDDSRNARNQDTTTVVDFEPVTRPDGTVEMRPPQVSAQINEAELDDVREQIAAHLDMIESLETDLASQRSLEEKNADPVIEVPKNGGLGAAGKGAGAGYGTYASLPGEEVRQRDYEEEQMLARAEKQKANREIAIAADTARIRTGERNNVRKPEEVGMATAEDRELAASVLSRAEEAKLQRAERGARGVEKDRKVMAAARSLRLAVVARRISRHLSTSKARTPRLLRSFARTVDELAAPFGVSDQPEIVALTKAKSNAELQKQLHKLQRDYEMSPARLRAEAAYTVYAELWETRVEGQRKTAKGRNTRQVAEDFVRMLQEKFGLNTRLEEPLDLWARMLRKIRTAPTMEKKQELVERYAGDLEGLVDGSIGGVTYDSLVEQDSTIPIALGVSINVVNTPKMYETLAHEVGHVVFRQLYMAADAATKAAIREAYNRWLTQYDGHAKSRDVRVSRQAPASAEDTFQRWTDGEVSREDISPDEWFADQVVKWLYTATKPKNDVDTFFAKAAQKLREFYAQTVAFLQQHFPGYKGTPEQEVARFLNQHWDYQQTKHTAVLRKKTVQYSSVPTPSPQTVGARRVLAEIQAVQAKAASPLESSYLDIRIRDILLRAAKEPWAVSLELDRLLAIAGRRRQGSIKGTDPAVAALERAAQQPAPQDPKQRDEPQDDREQLLNQLAPELEAQREQARAERAQTQEPQTEQAQEPQTEQVQEPEAPQEPPSEPPQQPPQEPPSEPPPNAPWNEPPPEDRTNAAAFLRRLHRRLKDANADNAQAFLSAIDSLMDPKRATVYTLRNALFNQLLTTGDERSILARAAMSFPVQQQMRKALKGHPDLIAQLDNAQTAAAYMYLLHRGGFITVGPKSMESISRISNDVSRIITSATGVQGDYAKLSSLFDAIQDEKVADRFDGRGDYALPADLQQTLVHKGVQKALRAHDWFAQKVTDKLGKNIYRRLMDTDNPALHELAKFFFAASDAKYLGRSYFEAERIESHRLGKLVEELLGDQYDDDTFMADLNRALIDRRFEQQATPEVREAAKRLKLEFFPQVHKYMNDGTGMDVGKIDGYSPWVFERDYLGAHADEFADLVMQPHLEPHFLRLRTKLVEAEMRYQNAGLPFSEKRTLEEVNAEYPTGHALVHRIIARTLDANGFADGADLSSAQEFHNPNFRFMNWRLFDFIRQNGNDQDLETLQKFMEPDLRTVLYVYTRQAVKRTEYARRFGVHGEKIQALLAEARDMGATDEQIQLAKDSVAAFLGTHGTGTKRWIDNMLSKLPLPESWRQDLHDGRVIGRRLQNLNGWMMTYQNLRILSLVTLSSMIDVLGVGVRSGSLATMGRAFSESIQAVWAEAGGDQPGLMSLADMLGSVERRLVADTMANRFIGVQQSRRQERINDAFFKATGLEAWTRFTRLVATAGATTFLKRHKLNPTEHSERYFAELNIDADDILIEDGELVVLDDEQRKVATKEERARDDRVRTALTRFVETSILRPDAAQRPLWMSDPHFALAGHLKNFMFSFHERILQRVWSEGVYYGDWTPLMLMSTYIPVMMAADELRELIQYGGDPKWQAGWSVADQLDHTIRRAGFHGRYEMFTNIGEDQDRGGFGVESLIGPYGGQISEVVRSKHDWIEVLPLQNLYKNWFEEGKSYYNYDDPDTMTAGIREG